MLGLFAVAFAVATFFAIRDRETPVAASPPIRLDPKAAIETRGGDVIQLKGARQDVRVEFDGQVTYEDGQSKLLGVKVSVENRGGRSFVVTAREGQLGKDQSAIDLTGDVTLTATDGLVAKARAAHYVEAEGVVSAPGPVEFTRGRMSGSGIGFTYDRQRDTLWLLDQAVVQFGAERNTPAMLVTSGAAGFARGDRYMRFERHVRMTRAGQVVEADEATVRLLPDRDEPEAIELRGRASIAGGIGMGSLRSMQARDISLDYAPDGRTLERATLAGGGALQFATPSGAAGQRLGAELIEVGLAPDGAVTNLVGRDAVKVALPAATNIPARTVSAASLTGVGAPGQGITAMRYEGGVEFREAATAARVARARTLDLSLAPLSGELQEASFVGGFRFEEGALRATSATGRYQMVKSVLMLREPHNRARPQVTDGRLTIDADVIDVTLAPRHIRAQGTVTTVIGAATRGAQGRTPSLLSAGDAMNIAADRLVFDGEAMHGVYTGGARLFQGDTVIVADSITLDEKRGDLNAAGKVRSTLGLAAGPADSKEPTPPTIARAAEFTFDESARRVTYTTGAHMNGPQGELFGDRIELLLAKDRNALDRLEADGQVKVVVDTRQATGAHLTYHPNETRYVLTGTPVRFTQECRETTGQTLTFYKGSDRISVDGNEEARTQSRGGAQCPDPRFD